MITKNKKGWIRIVEAFIAVLLITGVALILINRTFPGTSDLSGRVYNTELSILRKVQLDEDLRADILSNTVSLGINNTINSKKPTYLDCQAIICDINTPCSINPNTQGSIYVQSAIISANATTYNLKELKLFCWGI